MSALEPIVYNLGETAEVLRVHRATINRLITSGALPAVRIGSRTLIKRSDVMKMLDEMTTSTVPEAVAARGQRMRAGWTPESKLKQERTRAARESKRSTRK